MTRRSRLATVPASLLLVVGIIGGASGCSSSESYETVNTVASALELGHEAELLSEVRYGGGSGPVKEGLPSLEAFLVPSATTETSLTRSLQDLGFHCDDSETWTRDSPYTLVQIGHRSAGSTYTPPGKPSFTVQRPGGLVVIISSN